MAGDGMARYGREVRDGPKRAPKKSASFVCQNRVNNPEVGLLMWAQHCCMAPSACANVAGGSLGLGLENIKKEKGTRTRKRMQPSRDVEIRKLETEGGREYSRLVSAIDNAAIFACRWDGKNIHSLMPISHPFEAPLPRSRLHLDGRTHTAAGQSSPNLTGEHPPVMDGKAMASSTSGTMTSTCLISPGGCSPTDARGHRCNACGGADEGREGKGTWDPCGLSRAADVDVCTFCCGARLFLGLGQGELSAWAL
ncbi:hypothetical protein BX600DRAFT_320552 [Xylariales sp. PMI_506]|nr:hypothetical protein BX600DRAFT_320552 [Xylariales sp. PMI_506]